MITKLQHFYFAVSVSPLGIKIGAFYVCGLHNHYINNKARSICRKFRINWQYIRIEPISESYYTNNYWWLNDNK